MSRELTPASEPDSTSQHNPARHQNGASAAVSHAQQVSASANNEVSREEINPPAERQESPVAELIDSKIPGFKRANGKDRLKVLLLALFLCVAAVLIGSYFQLGFDLLNVGVNASAEDAANDAVDSAKPPFNLTVDSRTGVDDILSSGEVIILFENPLTESEQRRLIRLAHASNESPKATENFVGKVLSSFREEPTVLFAGQSPLENPWGRVLTPLQLTMQSDRSGSVVIRSMSLSDIRCSKTSTSTVVSLPPQGGGAVEGLMVDIVKTGGRAPLTKFEGKGGNYPYFSRNFVELGNGQGSWVANLDILSSNQKCRWAMEILYTESGESKSKKVENEKFYTSGYPSKPKQLFEFTPADKRAFSATCWGSEISEKVPCDVRASVDDSDSKESGIYYWGMIDMPR
ncbi:hypothetical protein [Streptomyces sp. NPDC102283]|uniref:hypothetical protein n=1 Tax=Streptomyces sp. NPDC102283 TaxID=3366155 RepID=UPI0038158656